MQERMVVETSESAMDLAVELGSRRGLSQAPGQLAIQISLETKLSHLEAAHKNGPLQTRACPKTLKTYKLVGTLGEPPLE